MPVESRHAPRPSPAGHPSRKIRPIEPETGFRAGLPLGTGYRRPPPGGWAGLGARQEVARSGNGALDGAAVAIFTAGVLARPHGPIPLCISRGGLSAPAFAQVGQDRDRVSYAEAGSDKAILACFEEGLRHGGLGGVVAKVAKLGMTTLRVSISARRLPRSGNETGLSAAQIT